jgi:hypothetical protein
MQENTHRENEKKAKTLERAKAFEHIFQINATQSRWLNNPKDDSYRAEAIPITKYDNFRNRIFGRSAIRNIH